MDEVTKTSAFNDERFKLTTGVCGLFLYVLYFEGALYFVLSGMPYTGNRTYIARPFRVFALDFPSPTQLLS